MLLSDSPSSGVRIFRNCFRMLRYKNTMAPTKSRMVTKSIQPGLTQFGSTSRRIMLKPSLIVSHTPCQAAARLLIVRAFSQQTLR